MKTRLSLLSSIGLFMCLTALAQTTTNISLTISPSSGIYPGPQSVSLTSVEGATIYYSLDGSKPTTSSSIYNAPINITANTVLKAVAIKSASEKSIYKSHSYIIGASHDLPVVLLTSDTSYKETPTSKLNIDGRVQFTFIEPDGDRAISQYTNFRASGKTSDYVPQLNGKLEAKKELGYENFEYKMFANKDINEFNRFLLRNSSQDWGTAHLRDAFVSQLLGQDNLVDVPFEGYRPAVLYVNAVYQGIIDIREDNDNEFVRDNYALGNSDFTNIGARDFIPYAFTTNRNELETKLSFNDHIHIAFLIDYLRLAEWGFSHWADNSGKTDHQSHYIFHDYDAVLGLYGEGSVYDLPDPMDVNFLPTEIKNHAPYKREAAQYSAVLLNHLYNEERTIGILNSLAAELESEINAHAASMTILAAEAEYPYPPFANLTEWNENVDQLKNNLLNRIDANIFSRINTEYALDGTMQVTYESSDVAQGFVRVHKVKSLPKVFTGTYFKGIPLQLTAEALPGHRFVRWEGDVTSTEASISPTFNSAAYVKAVFEPIVSANPPLVINEVQGKNDATVSDENGEFDDWIEIYNPNNYEVNLAGYFISDNLSNPLKWLIPATNSGKTAVPAKGYLLLWADKDLAQGENHLDFKIDGSDQVILTAPDAKTIVHQVSYTDVAVDHSYGAISDGSVDFIIFSTPTPNATNNTVTSFKREVAESESNLVIFPNPAVDAMTIRTLEEVVSWELQNTTGKTLLRGDGKTVNVEALEKGVYILTVNNQYTIKVIK